MRRDPIILSKTLLSTLFTFKTKKTLSPNPLPQTNQKSPPSVAMLGKMQLPSLGDTMPTPPGYFQTVLLLYKFVEHKLKETRRTVAGFRKDPVFG
jgi:hypothetical protein